jgi:dUTP pyrophosphatase
MLNLINKIKDILFLRTSEDDWLAELADYALENGGKPNQSFLEVFWDKEDNDILDSKKIKIKYLPGATRMKKVEKGDLIDCYAYETVELKKGESALINLGFACELPQGYEAHLYPRSSTFKNFKVLMTNSVGLIDSSFCGENDIWKMAVYAIEDTVIKAGERPCQFRIMECQPDIEFEEVDSLNNEERGGFGSSGR